MLMMIVGIKRCVNGGVNSDQPKCSENAAEHFVIQHFIIGELLPHEVDHKNTNTDIGKYLCEYSTSVRLVPMYSTYFSANVRSESF